MNEQRLGRWAGAGLEGTCLLHESFPVIEKYYWGEIKIGEGLVGKKTL